jgi:hypothetical protein
MKANKTMKGQAKSNHRRRKGKKAKSNIVSGILHTENESKQNHERAGKIKPQEKKRQESKE